MLILPESLRDKIKTIGFGMSVIELLCLVGVLHEENSFDHIEKKGLDLD